MVRVIKVKARTDKDTKTNSGEFITFEQMVEETINKLEQDGNTITDVKITETSPQISDMSAITIGTAWIFYEENIEEFELNNS